MNKSIRVLVANQPKLMREVILATFADQPDIEIVGEVSDEEKISESVNQTLPDFVVIALDDSGMRPIVCDRVLCAHPEIVFIAVSPEHDQSMCYSATLQIQCDAVEPSGEGILKVLRGKSPQAGGGL